MSDIVPWLRELAADGGKGVVNNIDARAIGRIADELERLRAERRNCPPVSESEYVRRLEDEIIKRDAMRKPLWELHSALKGLLELSEALMLETGRKAAPDGAISRAKTMLQIHEQAATEQLRSNP